MPSADKKKTAIEMIESVKRLYVIVTTSHTVCNTPIVQLFMDQYYFQGEGSKSRLGRKLNKADGGYYELELYPLMRSLGDNPDENLDVLRTAMSLKIPQICDYMKNHKLLKPTPEFEFFQHLRNAISHGNRFHFKYDRKIKLRKPAAFGSLKLDVSMHGKQDVLFNYIYPGDVMDLLDFIKANI